MSHYSFIENLQILSIKMLTLKTKLQLLLSDGTLKYHLLFRKNTKDVFKLCFNLTTDSAAEWFKYGILQVFLPIKNCWRRWKLLIMMIAHSVGIYWNYWTYIFISCFHSIAMWNQYSTHIYNTTSYIIILTYMILLLFVLELVLF